MAKKGTQELKVYVPNVVWKRFKEFIKEMTTADLKYLKEEESLRIAWTDKKLAKSVKNITDLMDQLESFSQHLTRETSELLKSKKVEDAMKQFCENDIENSIFEVKDDTLNLYCFGSGEENMKFLKERFLCKAIIRLQADLPISIFRDCVTHCNNNYLVSVSSDKPRIILTGLKEDVTHASKDIEQILKDYVWVEGEFVLMGREAMFVYQFALKHLISIFDTAEIANKRTESQNITINYKCRKRFQELLLNSLHDFKKTIKTVKVDLKELNKDELELINKNLNEDHVFLRQFQNFQRLCLDVTLCEKFKMHCGSVKNVPMCVLQVQPDGNIIKQETDLLVCCVPESLELKSTNISKAFLQNNPSLQTKIQSCTFSSNGVFVDKKSLPDSNCKAVAFIKIKQWNKNDSTKLEADLCSAVTEVLEKATEMRLCSLSIPPLGYGKALKFPANNSARVIINGIQSFQLTHTCGHNIRLINLLSASTPLHDEILREIDKIPSFVKDDNLNLVGSNKIKTPPKIFIITDVKEDVTSIFKAEIKSEWLFEDVFQSSDQIEWSAQFTNDMNHKAKSLGLLVWKTQNSSTKQIVCRIKGKKEKVNEMKTWLYEKVISLQHRLTKKHLFSPQTPRRNTLEFAKHAAYSEYDFPSYWKLNGQSRSDQFKFQLVDVDQKTYNAIENLVLKTWEKENAGHGRDATNISDGCGVKVIKIERIENRALFKKYNFKRTSIFIDICHRQELFKDVIKLQGSRGPVKSMNVIDNSLKTELLHEINEYYLFHGTKVENVNQICEQGLDFRLGSALSLFGKAVYTAESSTKADQYTDDRNNRLPNGSNLHMFLTRVAMGDIFVIDHTHPTVVQGVNSKKLTRPPCTSCKQDSCHCTGNSFFHSVMSDGQFLFREYIVYDQMQCYPEYLITHQRI